MRLGALSSLAAMVELEDTTVEPSCLDLAASRNIVQALISQSASRILGGTVLHRSSHRRAVLLAVEQTPRPVLGSAHPPMLRDCDSLPAFADLDLSAMFGFASGLSALFVRAENQADRIKVLHDSGAIFRLLIVPAAVSRPEIPCNLGRGIVVANAGRLFSLEGHLRH